MCARALPIFLTFLLSSLYQWHDVGAEAADPGLAMILDSMRFFLRPGGSPGTVLEDLAKTLNRVQTLRDLIGNGRGLIAAANASRPEYERYLSHSQNMLLELTFWFRGGCCFMHLPAKPDPV